MHRTRTAAALLATVAVTALSGCVTVDRPNGPGSPTGRSPATAPTSAGEHAEPQIERSPARESLRLVGEEPTGTATRPPRPRPTNAAPPANPGVCALGRQYGKWPPGSPQSRICEDTYGR